MEKIKKKQHYANQIGEKIYAMIRITINNYQKLPYFFNSTGGERDVLALAKDMNIKCIVCDDKKAINACKVTGLKFTTALNIVVAMCLKGKISKEEAEKQIDILDEFGWYNMKLIKKGKAGYKCIKWRFPKI